MLMQNMKKIEKTMNVKQMFEYLQGLIYCYIKETGKSLPDYFGNTLYVSDDNSKTGFPTINMPSLITCLIGLACNGLCYACKGHYVMDYVEIPRLSNLWLYLTSPIKFKLQLIGRLAGQRIARFNDSGDLVDYEYLKIIINSAIETGCNVHIFTKKHFLVNRFCKEYGLNNEKLVEKGVYIMFSLDPKIINVVNPYGFKLAGIVEDTTLENGTIINDIYICNHGNCLSCFIEKKGCFDKNIKQIDNVVHAASKADKKEYFNS